MNLGMGPARVVPFTRRLSHENRHALSRKASPKDRNIYPLIGDAAAITIVERDAQDSTIHAAVKSDGSRSDSLIIPAGVPHQFKEVTNPFLYYVVKVR